MFLSAALLIHLWRPKPSVHLATPRKNSFDRGGFRKTEKIFG
jgi:hypothetical protein